MTLDSYELTQRKGRSKSGTFIDINDINSIIEDLESWSRVVLKQFFYNKLSEKSQKVLDLHLLSKKTFSENTNVGKVEQLEI